MCIRDSFFESIHARSYTHILRNLLPDPTEFFDDIVPNPEIMARAQAVTKYYDDLYEKSISWRRGEIELTEVKKALILCIALSLIHISEPTRLLSISYA